MVYSCTHWFGHFVASVTLHFLDIDCGIEIFDLTSLILGKVNFFGVFIFQDSPET